MKTIKLPKHARLEMKLDGSVYDTDKIRDIHIAYTENVREVIFSTATIERMLKDYVTNFFVADDAKKQFFQGVIKSNKKELSPKQRDELLKALKARFETTCRHPSLAWSRGAGAVIPGARLCRRPAAAMLKLPGPPSDSNASSIAKLLRLAFSPVALRSCGVSQFAAQCSRESAAQTA